MRQENTNQTSAAWDHLAKDSVCGLPQGCGLFFTSLFFSSVQTGIGGGLLRLLCMKRSKLEKKRWCSCLIGTHPGFKNGSLGSPCTWRGGDRHVLGEWKKNLQHHSLPPSPRPLCSVADFPLPFPTPAFPLDSTGGGKGTGWVTIESSRASSLSLSKAWERWLLQFLVLQLLYPSPGALMCNLRFTGKLAHVRLLR